MIMQIEVYCFLLTVIFVPDHFPVCWPVLLPLAIGGYVVPSFLSLRLNVKVLGNL
jgi:hypothetical protein